MDFSKYTLQGLDREIALLEEDLSVIEDEKEFKATKATLMKLAAEAARRRKVAEDGIWIC